jgi:hypothetical protein
MMQRVVVKAESQEHKEGNNGPPQSASGRGAQ